MSAAALPPAVSVLRDWLLQYRPDWEATVRAAEPLGLWELGEALGAPWALLEQAWGEIAWAVWQESGQRYYVRWVPHATSAATLSAWRTL